MDRRQVRMVVWIRRAREHRRRMRFQFPHQHLHGFPQLRIVTFVRELRVLPHLDVGREWPGAGLPVRRTQTGSAQAGTQTGIIPAACLPQAGHGRRDAIDLSRQCVERGGTRALIGAERADGEALSGSADRPFHGATASAGENPCMPSSWCRFQLRFSEVPAANCSRKCKLMRPASHRFGCRSEPFTKPT